MTGKLTVRGSILDGNVRNLAIVDDNDSALETGSAKDSLGVENEAEGRGKLASIVTSFKESDKSQIMPQDVLKMTLVDLSAASFSFHALTTKMSLTETT